MAPSGPSTRLAAAAETWIEVKTSNFSVVSDAGEGTAQQDGRRVEEARAAYGEVRPWAHLAQGKPTVILALKNNGTLSRWAPGYFELKGGI